MRELEFKCYSPRCQFLKFVSNKLLCLSVCQGYFTIESKVYLYITSVDKATMLESKTVQYISIDKQKRLVNKVLNV